MDVRLPDGTIIKNVPEGITKAQLTEKLKANGMDVSGLATKPVEAPKGPTLGDRGQAALGGANRGVAGVLGFPVDSVENAINLIPQAVKTGLMAANKWDMANKIPMLKGSVGSSEWIANKMQGAGINTQNPNPNDPASRMLHTGGMVVGASPAGKAVPAALTAATAAIAGEVAPEFAAPAAMAAGGLAQGAQNARVKTAATRKAENAAHDAAVKAAREAGYTLPPSQANPSIWNRALEGFAGKIMTGQHASAKNQKVTNILAKRSLGLADDAPLSDKVLANMRDEAGQAYQAIKDFGGGKVKFKPDSQFVKEIDSIGGDFAKAAKEFPELAKVQAVDNLKDALRRPLSPSAAVELTKKLRHDASVNFKAFDNPEKLALAKAQKSAAASIEGLVERNLAKSGQGDLVRNFREARTTIARTYDIESALDTSGNVSAKAIAKLADKGKPLGSEAQKIADFADSFPRAAQVPANMGSLPGLSPLDYIAGGAGFAIDPTLAALATARPAVRSGILSGPYQRAMGAPSYNVSPAESDLAVLLRPSVLANK